MSNIELREISKSYGDVEVMNDINLEIQDGEFIVLVGPSGCGKSTLLRMIAGLEPITAGDLLFDDELVNELAPRDRDIAMVFQSYALYPHMDVARNMGFSLEIRGEKAQIIDQRTQKSADTLGLKGLLDRLPKALSGGQRQRVAMGRAIARDPKAFLFDEPLSNLDAALRVEMRLEIAKLHQRLGATMIYVTHDQVEALTLADRIVVLNEGKIQQIGRPLELYQSPANLFVANFIGSPTMNIFDVKQVGAELQLVNGALIGMSGGGAAVSFGIRPEHIAIVAQDKGHVVGTAEVVERLGSDSNIYTQVEGLGQVLIRHHGNTELNIGDKFGLEFNVSAAHLFDSDGIRLTLDK
ncbi:MAG: sn-glycerol-3-phosphate ABC transporter ATP-binding protein UgpC [Alphaproteobacteria bacterium]|nr:sn-glycerol-3-phosphate ABC transporter ATP-binding protein UgpC [Alphaproteobacteria bacterium]